jgi:hypothetical protein
MSLLNSSISNSSNSTFRRVGTALAVPLWVCISLAAIDVFINIALSYPSDPKVINPPRLRLYFEYGRSTEGQLLRMTRADKALTAPITLSGWYDPLEVQDYPAKSQNNPVVTIYGMSHAVRLGQALSRTSDNFTARTVGAPGASTNWSYGAFLRDLGGAKSRAVVLAFMSQNFPMITTLSAMTWTFDLPMPYTSDRFYLKGDHLEVIHPPYESFERYVAAFCDPAMWPIVRDYFSKHDSMYNSFIFRLSIFDHSSLFRLIRRAYAQRVLRDVRNTLLSSTGFRSESEQVKVARAMIHEFAVKARGLGMIPVIYIVNNLGYSDFLFKALNPALQADNVPYLSSHTVVSPDDPRGYLPDSHFTDDVDDKLARALAKVIAASN